MTENALTSELLADLVAEDMAVFRRNWNGPDMREGIAAFLERRDPRYAAL